MSNFLRLSVVSIIILTFCSSAYARTTTERIGDWTQVLVPVYAFGLTMQETTWEGAEQFINSFAAMQVTVLGFKYGIVPDARRPDGGRRSFPSGHAASAFTGATFIHRRYGMRRAIIPYLLAAFTGYSRVYANRHYIHDVVAGALISDFFSRMFVSEYSNVRISVNSEPGKIGLRITF